MWQKILRRTGQAWWVCIFLVYGSSALQNACGADVIGREALIEQPKESFYYSAINTRPGDGDTVRLNPPIFSWPYVPNPTTMSTDLAEYAFQFQVSYSNDFRNPVVDKRTPWNCYNLLAPFVKTGQRMYWRVGYITVTNNVTKAWVTNSFLLAPDAQDWDRSMLANEAYLSSRKHPYMLFNAANRAAVYDHLRTKQSLDWYNLTNRVGQAVGSPWWGDPTPWVVDRNIDYDGRAFYIGAVTIAWGLSNSSQYTNGLVRNYTNLVSWFLASGKHLADYGNGDSRSPIQALAIGYDILYPILNTEQRASALKALRAVSYHYTRNFGWKTTNSSGRFPPRSR